MIETRSDEAGFQQSTRRSESKPLAQSIVDNVSDEVGGFRDETLGKAKNVGDQVKAAAGGVKDAAGGVLDAAKGFAANAGDQVKSTIAGQKTAGADRASNVAAAMRRAADDVEADIPLVAPYLRKAADEIDDFADAIRTRNIGEIMGTVEDFARRQPAAFLGAAALGGFAVVRLLKVPVNESREKRGLNK